ncbi:MAG: formylglycine-generating enzyme family protein [Ardenticatenaceae bacterium]|nr:formylglycine-generating enzyme family protein [Ardenticatenaceae bacterium]
MQLYPLLLRACRVPALWRAYQRISLRSGYSTALRQLLAALAGGKPLPTAPPVRTPPADPNRWLHPKSGLELVRVPAGEFLYGDDKKKLHLDEFWMAKTPVTNAEYKRFLDANPNYDVPFRDETWAKPYNWDKQQRTFPAGKAEHPVVLVSWHDAQAFAKWAGMVLPTEEQWQKAARGTDGREYPWGEWRAGHCNTSETGIGATTPVGQFSPQGDSPYGCVDMSGNVWEWTNSWYDEKQVLRVLCGGSWPINRRFARVALRSWYDPDNSFNHIGFRVVSPVVSGF